MIAFVAALLLLAPPSGLTVRAPAEAHVDAWIPVSGTVRVEPGERRPVRLQEQVVGRWHVVERTRATRAGRYEMLERSGFTPQVRTFRVVAPRADGLRRAVSRPFEVSMFVHFPDPA